MIYEVRDKVDGSRYTVAVCNGCRTTCPESKLPDRSGDAASAEAVAVAKRHGFTERYTSTYRRSGWTVELLCPGCAKTPAPTLAEQAAAYCCVHPVKRGGGRTHHCGNKRGHGPGGEYCRTHANLNERTGP